MNPIRGPAPFGFSSPTSAAFPLKAARPALDRPVRESGHGTGYATARLGRALARRRRIRSLIGWSLGGSRRCHRRLAGGGTDVTGDWTARLRRLRGRSGHHRMRGCSRVPMHWLRRLYASRTHLPLEHGDGRQQERHGSDQEQRSGLEGHLASNHSPRIACG
jgi:hypothetical protein